jgi:hypothetical protein
MDELVSSYLDSQKNTRMNNETSEMFIKVTLLDNYRCIPFTEKEARKLGTFGMILYNRLTVGPVIISSGVGVFCIWLAEANPGKVVMWAYTLNRIYNKNHRIVTMTDLAFAFADGFPTEEEQKRIWLGQKCFRGHFESDNLLDYPETWELDK